MSKLYKSFYRSPLGTLTIISDDRHLLKLYPCEGKTICTEESEPIRLTKNWLDLYFSGSQPSIDTIPILAEGTPFQQRCWQQLLHIPYGSTTSYKAIAELLSKESLSGRMSCQAVGQAIGKNPITIIIPCHRVIGSNGNLTGYSGGLELKKALLLHELTHRTAL